MTEIETGTRDARRPSRPITAVLRSSVMVPIHSRGAEILNEEERLGSRVSTSERANGRSVAPAARNRWPKAYRRSPSI